MSSCYDSRSTYEYGRAEAKGEIDKLTRMLCTVLGLVKGIEKYERQLLPFDAEIEEWWKEHQVMDAQRTYKI